MLITRPGVSRAGPSPRCRNDITLHIVMGSSGRHSYVAVRGGGPRVRARAEGSAARPKAAGGALRAGAAGARRARASRLSARDGGSHQNPATSVSRSTPRGLRGLAELPRGCAPRCGVRASGAARRRTAHLARRCGASSPTVGRIPRAAAARSSSPGVCAGRADRDVEQIAQHPQRAVLPAVHRENQGVVDGAGSRKPVDSGARGAVRLEDRPAIGSAGVPGGACGSTRIAAAEARWSGWR